jgi:D-3-phosphoglycerate dehydrogenase / 2-oxoglutarate reductase
MAIKVVLTDGPFSDISIEREILGKIGVNLLRAPGSSVSEIVSLAVDADALLVCWADIPAKLISQLKRCRFISLYTAGFNNVDLGAATEAGIAVSNNPGYCTDEVATHTLSLLLACHRRLFLLKDRVKSGIWEPVASMQPTPSLKEQTVGILGYGRIGRQLAEWVAPLCGRVIAYERNTKISPQDSLPAEMVSLDQLLRESDYLSIHLPLNPSTQHMLGRDALAKMKPTAYVVNTSRGLILDEEALIEALGEKKLAGAALDVFTTEPLPVGHPFRTLPNVIITPHVAWYSERSEYLLHANAPRKIVDFFEGRPVRLLNSPGKAEGL